MDKLDILQRDEFVKQRLKIFLRIKFLHVLQLMVNGAAVKPLF